MSGSRKTVERCRETFTTFVYQEDFRKIQELVQMFPNIETGGDLFGLWQDDRTVIIQRFIGSGELCKRTPTSFHQDVEYLRRVGSLITTEEGLCNVGEWHSHHQMGMPEPSDGDLKTVFNNMPELGLERFMLFIATIESEGFRGKKRPQVQLSPFLFISSMEKVIKGIKINYLLYSRFTRKIIDKGIAEHDMTYLDYDWDRGLRALG